jgi:hypothetical protein
MPKFCVKTIIPKYEHMMHTYVHTMLCCGHRIQLSARVARFFLLQHTKAGANIPNNQIIYLQNGHKIYQQLPSQYPPIFTQI